MILGVELVDGGVRAVDCALLIADVEAAFDATEGDIQKLEAVDGDGVATFLAVQSFQGLAEMVQVAIGQIVGFGTGGIIG